MTPLRIEFDFKKAKELTPTQRRVLFEGAKDRWLNVVLGWRKRPDGSPVTLPGGTPLRYLRVFVEIADLAAPYKEAFALVPVDQLKPLGKDMGPSAGLPYEGTIKINRRNLGMGNAEPARFKDSIVHELGHILGVGTVFHQKKLVQKSGRSYFFTGGAATRAYAESLGRETGTEMVPLVSEPGGSTPAYHWDEKKLRLEIMSETLDGETVRTRTFEFNAISAITVGALQDIGYEVDMQNAEPYQPPRRK